MEQSSRFTGEMNNVFDSIPDPMVIVDPQFEVIWGNRAAATQMARPLDELPGCRCYELWHQRKTVCDNCPVVRSLASGENEEQLVTDHLGRTFSIKSFPLRDASGRIERVATLAIDITEKIRLREEALRQSRLASLGELAAGVAHEINNPNALILLNAPVLHEICQDLLPILDRVHEAEGDFSLGRLPYSRLRENLPRMHLEIMESAQRIRRIVEDLKNFVRDEQSSIESGVVLNEAVDAAIRLVDNTIKKSTAHFTAILGKRMPKSRGDLQRLEQVAVNLLVNACQALPDRTRSITVRTWHDEERRVNVLEVADQGVGIAAKDLPRIGEPFFTTRREKGGTGLGMSVSLNIVRGYGGELRIASDPGHGTKVTMALPAFSEKELP